MLFTDSLIQQLARQFGLSGKISIACLSTTNPVYLVFSQQDDYPNLVVRHANTEHVCQAHVIIQQLYAAVGDLVAEPVALSEFGGLRLAIQKGMRGIPWFQLSANYQTNEQWNELRGRALDALTQLHEGTKKFSNWTLQCEPGNQLRHCYQACLTSGTDLPSEVRSLVDKQCEQLDKMGRIAVHHQHGDYCLNNLLVEADKIHIIDFEDFGMTSMPLHDEFSLALSMFSQAPTSVDTSLQHEISQCVLASPGRLALDRSVLPGLFMHHLLLRLGHWSQGKRRLEFRDWLLSILKQFTQAPWRYFEG